GDASYDEIQRAIELEQLADPGETGAYFATLSESTPVQVRGADLVLAATEDLLAGIAPPIIAARFHNGVADMIVRTCMRLRTETGLTTVALSGGVFQNLLLLTRTVDHLRRNNFRV